ncbi:MAG: rod shape-determining protein MreC [Candidatus Paceibacterota bacterium]
MSYLLDKKIKQKKIFRITLGVGALLILFFFRSGIFSGLSYISQGVFHPVFLVGNDLGGKLKNLSSYFYSKNSLTLENQDLKTKLLTEEMRIANYNTLLAENENLKEILGRKNSKSPMVLAAILAKPNQSPYDILTIDIGTAEGATVGQIVFALGNIPIGRIAEVYPNSSKVILFSSAGEKTQVSVAGQNLFLELVGRGGGNFEMIMPKDLTLEKGVQVVLPGINSYVVAINETIISDPRNPFTKALLVSPVNIQNLKFVEVEI